MPNRTRPIRKEICLNESEWNLIQHKMRQLGTRNFGTYARKMLIDGYIIKVDYTEQKKLAAVSRIASNVSQICRRINSTGHFYEDDIAELKERVAEVGHWDAVEGVNVTLGLPIIRTSVDHGTGFGHAGDGHANALSLVNALGCAITLAQHREPKENG